MSYVLRSILKFSKVQARSLQAKTKYLCSSYIIKKLKLQISSCESCLFSLIPIFLSFLYHFYYQYLALSTWMAFHPWVFGSWFPFNIVAVWTFKSFVILTWRVLWSTITKNRISMFICSFLCIFLQINPADHSIWNCIKWQWGQWMCFWTEIQLLGGFVFTIQAITMSKYVTPLKNWDLLCPFSCPINFDMTILLLFIYTRELTMVWSTLIQPTMNLDTSANTSNTQASLMCSEVDEILHHDFFQNNKF